MSELSKMMRQKRFEIQETSPVRLVIETAMGVKCELRVRNCSLTGIGATAPSPERPDAAGAFEGLELGSLVPASKIVVENHEISLGRLVVRRISISATEVYLACSTIDSRLPIDGILSKYLVGDLDDRKSPYGFELSSDRFNLGSFVDTHQNNVDLFHRAEQFEVFWKEWKESTKFQYFIPRLASKGTRVRLRKTRRGGRNDYIIMGSNDYLGLAASPEVTEAAKRAIDEYGFGSTGSAPTTGLSDIHEELSAELGRIFKKEQVLLFNSGYAANVGVITGITQPNDLVIADVISHASIQDGMQMSRATCRFFKHNDVAHLDRMLAENRESHAGSLVVTEGVFSMDGDVPPLRKIIQTARKHNSRVMVDEAHSFGVIGPTGLGAWESCPDDNVDIIMGTFSKICGGIGGFIAVNQSVADWLRAYARSHMFSVTIPPSTAAAALAALRVFAQRPGLLAQLRENIQYFLSGLRELGFDIPTSHESAVVPVVIGDEKKLGIMNEVFRDSGVFVIPIVFPAVGRRNCRFRFTVSAAHTVSDLDYVLNVLEKAMIKAEFEPVRAGDADQRSVAA